MCILLKFNKNIVQIIMLDLICDIYQRINPVVFILASSDFSNEGYGHQTFCYFRQKSPIAISFSTLFENGYCQLRLSVIWFLNYLTKYYSLRWEFG